MGMTKHVDYILHICNERTYLLAQFERLGLPQMQLQSVFAAIILASVLYASPAWKGYLNSADIDSLQRLSVKVKSMANCHRQL